MPEGARRGTILKTATQDPWVGTGLGVWIAYGFVIGVLALVQPFDRTLTPFYVGYTTDFWHVRPELPNAAHGFYYLPASRVLFSPFAFVGVRIGGLLWRLLAYGLITAAAFRWANLLAPERASRVFVMILMLTLPASASVLRNGQFDGPAWALMSLGAAAVAQGYWWGAAAALGIGLAIKPTAIVAGLLMGAMWPPLGIRLLPVVVVMLAIPYVNPNWAYVGQLYMNWLPQTAGAVQEQGRWHDIGNALAYAGVGVSYGVMIVVRIFAALGALALGLVAVKRLPRIAAAFMGFMLTAVYLLLFNPRTEGSSYVGLALVAAPIAACLVVVGRRWVWGGVVAAMAVLPGLVGLTPLTSKLFIIWLDPLLALIFLVGVLMPRALSPTAWTLAESLGPPKRSAQV